MESLLFWLDAAVWAVLIGSSAGWVIVGIRLLQGFPVVTPMARLRPLYGLSELLLMAGLWALLAVVGRGLIDVGSTQLHRGSVSAVDQTPVKSDSLEEGLKDSPLASPPKLSASSKALLIQSEGWKITVGGGMSLLMMVVMLTWLLFIDRSAIRRIGLLPKWRDFGLGFVASGLLIPPLFIMQFLLNKWIHYEHPVQDVILANPPLWIGLSMAVNAILIAPLSEEFLFRGILQGCCQFMARRNEPQSEVPGSSVDGTGEEGGEVKGLDPYHASDAVASGSHSQRLFDFSDTVSIEEIVRWRWWPVFLSSALFALAHWGQGAAPIALFFFALGLGYLYRQTGRLWVPITVHFALNAISVTAMFANAAYSTSP